MSLRQFIGTMLWLAASTAPILVQAASPPAQQNAIPSRYRGLWMRAVHQLNLTATQQQRIEAAIDHFRQAHPPGTTANPSARKALREQIMALLTPSQRQRVQDFLHQMQQQHPGDAGAPYGPEPPSPSPSPSPP